MASFIVFKQIEGGNDAGAWDPISGGAVEAATADAAIESTRTTAGTFVAVLVRGFRPRTHYAPPRPPAAPKPATSQEVQ